METSVLSRGRLRTLGAKACSHIQVCKRRIASDCDLCRIVLCMPQLVIPYKAITAADSRRKTRVPVHHNVVACLPIRKHFCWSYDGGVIEQTWFVVKHPTDAASA